MTGLVPFSFEGAAFRVVDRGGAPVFVAADVCAILDLGNVSMAVAKLDEDEKGISSVETPGGVQDMLTVTEGGLYTLILRCRDATTPGTTPHRFRRWVTGEVLPAIRRTGGYGAAALPDLSDPAVLLELLTEHAGKRIEAERRAQVAEQTAELSQGALNRIAGADGSFSVTDAAKDLQVRPCDLFDFLRQNRWIYRRPGCTDDTAYQDKIQAGYLTHKVTTVERPDGTEKVVQRVRVTAKGIARLARVFTVAGRPGQSK